ncbi:hypothetical protein DFH07DRAFT_784901 [Mycena maculata]|uniref:Uncharacterized protein n=1 Tax=Mycena maculata TaxID=230809 RepID=A0AAD7HET4_9AGAR|nr:hypothetical protein DFH07DRAFT_784901 [Mycena maculata]
MYHCRSQKLGPSWWAGTSEETTEDCFDGVSTCATSMIYEFVRVMRGALSVIANSNVWVGFWVTIPSWVKSDRKRLTLLESVDLYIHGRNVVGVRELPASR